jgi:hypothetical protein
VVIGQVRLDKVGEPTRRLLELAAVLGDGGLMTEMRAVTRIDDATTAHLLTETGDAGLLDDDGPSYRSLEWAHQGRGVSNHVAAARLAAVELAGRV